MMEEFIISNYSWLISIFFGVLSVVILFLKKAKVVMKDTPLEKVISMLPSFIVKAEKSIKGGAEKKSFVVSCALTALSEYLCKSYEEVSDEYFTVISKAIEDILCTPVKKVEVKDEK